MACTAEEIRDWLRLTQIRGVGPETVRHLLNTFGLPAEIFAQSQGTLMRTLPEGLARALSVQPDAALATLIEHTQQWAGEPGNHVVTLADAEYPPALLALADAPPVLYIKGDPHRLTNASVAIVGSRHATPQGLANAEAFAHTLGDAGLTIVSGLAAGVDGAAHAGALGTTGTTVAVVGTGLDIVYPSRHRELAHRIAVEGALLSEFPLGTPGRAHNFPRRNRLIAALCQGTLVVEAAIQSGSLITARLAGELGREVFAIPGSIHSPLAKGCHCLIKQGAKLVESAQDVYEELRCAPAAGQAQTAHEQSGARAARGLPMTSGSPAPKPTSDMLLNALGYDPVNIDHLCDTTGLPAADVQRRLFEHELEGTVLRLPGGRYQRAAP